MLNTVERARYGSLSAKKNRDREPWKTLEGNITYLYPASLKPDDVKARTISGNLKDKDGLVIDLRCYPSQFIVFSLGARLVPDATEFVKFSKAASGVPGAFEMIEYMPLGRRNRNAFQGKVAILIDERTQSQAEYTAMAMRVAPNAKVFGSTTAGADGNVSAIYLPGGIRTMISGIGVYTPEGNDTQRIGILPDVKIRPTVDGIRDGRDEVLEKALEWVREKE